MKAPTSAVPTMRALRRLLVLGAVMVGSLGLGAELWYASAPSSLSAAVGNLFSLSHEANVPTWYSSVLLFACASLLARIAQLSRDLVAHWWGLTAIFLLMSLDEVAELHEGLADLVDGGSLIYFNWVIPAAAVVLVVGLAYLPFLRRLDATARRSFVAAGMVYVFGALVMELPLGWWVQYAGDQGLVYVFIDAAEEILEITGASMFLLALWAHLNGHEGRRESA